METDIRPDDMLPDVNVPIDNDFTRIVVILDRSGSMSMARESTVAGFNEFVRTQQALPGQASLKLVQFDDQYDVVFDKPLAEVPEMTQDMFVPRGWTAMLDAQGKTITALQEEISKMAPADRPTKVVIVTLTDGMENRSEEYNQKQVADLMAKMQEQYKWQFIYLGANQDAIKVGATMNVPAFNSMSYGVDRMGSTMSAASASVSRLRGINPITYSNLAPDQVSSVMSFTEEERRSVVGDSAQSTVTTSSFDPTLTITGPDPDKDDKDNA